MTRDFFFYFIFKIRTFNNSASICALDIEIENIYFLVFFLFSLAFSTFFLLNGKIWFALQLSQVGYAPSICSTASSEQ